MNDTDQIAAIAKHGGFKEEYFIVKRGLYYRPKSCGYTDSIEAAGRFTKEYAKSHVNHSDKETPITMGAFPFPDYLNNLNSMHEVEMNMGLYHQKMFIEKLVEVVNRGKEIVWEVLWAGDSDGRLAALQGVIHATARQRAEAYLLAIGEWK